jgi:hypothetical protein
MLRTLLLTSLLSGCATFSASKPIGEPGPIACISSTSAEQAWLEIDKYMRQVLEAQLAYSCGPLAPPPAATLAPEAPLVPPLR